MDEKRPDNNKKYQTAIRKALLILAALIVLVLTVILIQDYKYIKIFMKAKTNDSETIQQNLEQTMADLDDKLDMLVSPVPTVLPPENTAANSGQAEQIGTAEPTGVSQPSPGKTSSQDYAKELEQHYLVLENLKYTFLSRLEGIVQSAKDEYAALPAKEQTKDSKINIVVAKAFELEALEAECDAQVKAEVDAIRNLLKSSGQDTSLADEIQAAYENMKDAKKTEYINELYS